MYVVSPNRKISAWIYIFVVSEEFVAWWKSDRFPISTCRDAVVGVILLDELKQEFNP